MMKQRGVPGEKRDEAEEESGEITKHRKESKVTLESTGAKRVRFAARGKMVVACMPGHSPTIGVGWMMDDTTPKGKNEPRPLLRLASRCDARGTRTTCQVPASWNSKHWSFCFRSK
jgi:hypothetical protein